MTTQPSIVAQQVRLRQWAEQVQACRNRPEGMDVETWCSQNNITKANYYYRLRRVNEDFIRNHIFSELKIELRDISLSFIAPKLHEKYSESAKKNKVYVHKFYLATIKHFPEYMTKDTFECDGKRYYWKSIADLEQDADVRKKNQDILNFVKELF